jgi:drug/metabolite transporter (DMT)-like permease
VGVAKKNERLESSTRSLVIALAMVFAIGITWGLAFPLNRIATLGGIPFLPYVFWQLLGACVIQLVIAIPLRALPRFDWPHLRAYLILGFFGAGVPYSILAVAAPKVPAGTLALVSTLEPMAAYVLVLVFVLERFHPLRVGGLLLGLAGVLVILLPETSLPSPDMAPWILLGFTASISWALMAIFMAIYRPPESRALTLSCGLLGAACLFLLPAMAIADSWWFFDAAFEEHDWALIAMMPINAIIFALVLESIRIGGVVIYSTWAYVTTLAGIGFGMLIFGERHSVWIWLSLVLLFLGMSLVSWGHRAVQRPRE